MTAAPEVAAPLAEPWWFPAISEHRGVLATMVDTALGWNADATEIGYPALLVLVLAGGCNYRARPARRLHMDEAVAQVSYALNVTFRWRRAFGLPAVEWGILASGLVASRHWTLDP